MRARGWEQAEAIVMVHSHLEGVLLPHAPLSERFLHPTVSML